MPENSTSFIITNIQGNVKKFLGNLYGLRTWTKRATKPPGGDLQALVASSDVPSEEATSGSHVEYGFRQCKQELGWTNYRFTSFKDIENWWEIIFSVYTVVSLNSQPFLSLNQQQTSKVEGKKIFW